MESITNRDPLAPRGNFETDNGGPVDPLALRSLQEILSDRTFGVYKSTWLDFVNFAKISIEKPPKESDFYDFFMNKRSLGIGGSSIRCFYSHLNKCYTHLYKEKLAVSTEMVRYLHRFYLFFILEMAWIVQID